MFANANDTRNRKGTALIIVMSLMMIFTGLVFTMVVLQAHRDVSEMRSAERLERMYAVESGLERARLEVIKDGMWLENNKVRAKAVWTNGTDVYAFGNYTVVVTVADEAGTWCSVTSTATESNAVVSGKLAVGGFAVGSAAV